MLPLPLSKRLKASAWKRNRLILLSQPSDQTSVIRIIEELEWSVGQLPYHNVLCVTDSMGNGFFLLFLFLHHQYLHNINLRAMDVVLCCFLSSSPFAVTIFFRLFHKEKVQLSAEGRGERVKWKPSHSAIVQHTRRIIMSK